MSIFGNAVVRESQGEQTEEHREAEKKDTRVRLTKWGKDHVQFGNSKITLCGQKLPIQYRVGRGGPRCVRCRRVLMGKPKHRSPKLVRFLRLVKTGLSRDVAYDRACTPVEVSR